MYDKINMVIFMISEEIIKLISPISKEEERFLLGKKDIDRNLYMESDSSIINSKKMLKDGKLITMRAHPRFVHFPKHSHEFIELVYMCKGMTRHIVNGDELILNEGEILLLGQNAMQEIYPAGEGDIAVNLIILPEFFDSSLDMLKDEETPLKSFIIDSLKDSGNNSCYMHFKVSEVLPVQNLMENLIISLMSPSPNRRKINGYTLGLLFLQLINHSDKLQYTNEEENAVIKALKYIDENYREGSLTELSERLHYNFNWLSREIKRKTGKTYTEAVQERRLVQAVFFLENTDINISDIASLIGYDNISYFHRLFYKKFGVSPKKYRININK